MDGFFCGLAVGVVGAYFMFLIGFNSGKTNIEHEAAKQGVAHYIVGANGSSEFKWIANMNAIVPNK
jgi:hypothetical protein